MFRTIGIIACAVAMASCATITRGSHEAFVVNTTPSGAHVALSTGQTCDSTPCTFAGISRKAEFTVTISKPGYVTSTHAVAHSTAGGGAAGMAGNVLLGGIIGAAVDANSGATQQLVPNPLNVTLEAEAAPTPAPTPTAAAEATVTPTVAQQSAAH